MAYRPNAKSVAARERRANGPPREPGEEWRVVPSWPRYLVSNRGRVWSVHLARLLRTTLSTYGYPEVGISQDCRVAHVRVHAMVAEAFIGARPEGFEVAHNNGNRTDARAENLRYATRAENARDAHAHKTTPCGERCGRRKLSMQETLAILGLRGSMSAAEAARRHGGIGASQVRRIWSGQCWGRAIAWERAGRRT